MPIKQALAPELPLSTSISDVVESLPPYEPPAPALKELVALLDELRPLSAMGGCLMPHNPIRMRMELILNRATTNDVERVVMRGRFGNIEKQRTWQDIDASVSTAKRRLNPRFVRVVHALIDPRLAALDTYCAALEARLDEIARELPAWITVSVAKTSPATVERRRLLETIRNVEGYDQPQPGLLRGLVSPEVLAKAIPGDEDYIQALRAVLL